APRCVTDTQLVLWPIQMIHRHHSTVMPGLDPGIHGSRHGHAAERGWPGLSHGCPVEFYWTRSMALIPLGSGRFADGPDTRRGVNAMRHQNSVFHGVLKHIPWDVFERLVDKHGADSRVRRLNTKSQFVALLYGQLAGAVSLREIVTGLASHAARLYHLGVRPAQRSTLADADLGRPSAVFGGLFGSMVQRV